MRQSRKGHYSCVFCRSRKLRCDRPLPCTNCVSRGKTCQFGPDTGPDARTPSRAPRARGSTTVTAQQRQPASGVSIPSPRAAAPCQEDLLSEIRSLKKLAHDLEQRVTYGASRQLRSSDNNVSVPDLCPEVPTVNAGPPPSSGLGGVGEVVAHLERVSMGKGSCEPGRVDDLVLKIERIRAIPEAPSYVMHLGKQVRCVWLPQLDETKVLLETFVDNISYIYHAVHRPSLPSFVDDIYCRIAREEPVKPGHVFLLLSIIASATLGWLPPDGGVGGEGQLFNSSAEATSQATLWAKAAQDVLNGGENGPPLTLETIQGIVILSFLVCNIEGVSLRYRLLVSTGLLLGRELGLHRIDHESNAAAADTLEAEMGRRAWWYLVATDWLMAARYGGPGEGVYQANPCQMAVKKPRNVNDADLLGDHQGPDPPISQPTDMSYFLQRIRLAEISRNIADHNSMAMSGSARPDSYEHIMAIDAEFDKVMSDIPDFFNLDTYDYRPDHSLGGIFIQAYLLNSILQTQRCKLHLGYLTSRPNKSSPAYASSWSACLRAARQINRAEKQLERATHPFVLIRRRLSGILYGVLMASVVLLMDACVNGSGAEKDEARRRETEEALRVVGSARSYSATAIAAGLYDSLTEALAKHRTQAQQPHPRDSALLRPEDVSPAASWSTGATTVHMDQGPDVGVSADVETQVIREDTAGQGPLDPLGIADGQASDSYQMAQDLEQLLEMDGFQWDGLFCGLNSSSFL